MQLLKMDKQFMELSITLSRNSRSQKKKKSDNLQNCSITLHTYMHIYIHTYTNLYCILYIIHTVICIYIYIVHIYKALNPTLDTAAWATYTCINHFETYVWTCLPAHTHSVFKIPFLALAYHHLNSAIWLVRIKIVGDYGFAYCVQSKKLW